MLQTFHHSDHVSPRISRQNLFEIDENNEMTEEMDGDSNSVECVGFSPTELRWVASGGLDKSLKIWDSATGICRFVEIT